MARFKYTNTKLRSYEQSLPQRGRRTVERTGRIWERSAKDRAAVDTGEMRDKAHFEMTGDSEGTMHADADHSGFVEFGTVHQGAQPWFIPAAEDARQAFPGIARDEFKP